MTINQQPQWMGKMRGLTADEIKEFLAGPIVARVATIAEDGSPYITPVWQEYDGKELWFIPRAKTVLVRHLQSDARVAVSCALDASPYTRVLLRGTATIAEGPAELQGRMLQMAERMAVRYLGERGIEYLAPTYTRPRYLVRVTPEQIISWEGVEWHARYL